MRRAAALVAALGLLGATTLGLAPAAGAQALAIGQCTTSANAVVAVNFGHWGGPIVRQCGSTPTTGFGLLNQGSFSTQGTAHDGPGFVCRISSTQFHGGPGYPTKAQEPCGNTPPANAYWSYWHADPGQHTWTYSTLGAMSSHPKPGSVDYWQFGATDVSGTQGRPSIGPDQVRARNSAPTGGSAGGGAGGGAHGGTTHGGGAGTGGRGGTTNGGGRGAAVPGGAARPTAPAAGHSSTSGRPSAAASSKASTARSARGPATGSTSAGASGAGGPAIVDARPASAEAKRPSTGSVLPVLLGVTLAVLLAAGTGWTVYSRRRAGG